MAHVHEGGCLCGDIRYRTMADPMRTTICHCTFCQRLTGSAFLVEPIFRERDVYFTGAALKVFERRSEGSHKQVAVHFCGKCGTAICLSFERFPGVLGLCGGTFDDPNWFDRGPASSRHIFARWAQKGVVLPAGVEIYFEHVTEVDGTPNRPRVLYEPLVVSDAG